MAIYTNTAYVNPLVGAIGTLNPTFPRNLDNGVPDFWHTPKDTSGTPGASIPRTNAPLVLSACNRRQVGEMLENVPLKVYPEVMSSVKNAYINLPDGETQLLAENIGGDYGRF